MPFWKRTKAARLDEGFVKAIERIKQMNPNWIIKKFEPENNGENPVELFYISPERIDARIHIKIYEREGIHADTWSAWVQIGQTFNDGSKPVVFFWRSTFKDSDPATFEYIKSYIAPIIAPLKQQELRAKIELEAKQKANAQERKTFEETIKDKFWNS